MLSAEEINSIISKGKAYVMVHLLKGPDRSHDEEARNRIQHEHLSYLLTLQKEKKLLINGPVLADGDLLGVSIYNTSDVEEARLIAENDPAVKAGRLSVKAFAWFGLPGDCLI